MSLKYQIPICLQRLYGGVVWRGGREQKVVYLTFDDGPIPEVTPLLLDVLDRYGVKATFFCVGENVARYPDLARDIVRRGHAIGNHTYHHLRGWRTPLHDYVTDVQQADDVLHRILGDSWQPTGLMRPPHGRMTGRQKRCLRRTHTIVLWDVLTHDYNAKAYTPERILRIVKRFTRNGSVLVFHDSIKSQPSMLQALPQVIEWLLAQGYQLATLKK